MTTPLPAPVDDQQDDDPADPAAARQARVRNAVEWVVIVVGAFVVALLVKTFLIQAFYIPSASMFPTLKENDRVLVNKLSYDLHDVNRGDMVVFKRPPGEADSAIKDLIKRVVGLPGETIESTSEGRVLVDGAQLDEPYLDEGVQTLNVARQTIPEGHVFVMGDNRGDSRDSRFFGAIDESLIVGRAFVRVWPIPEITLL